MVADLNPLIRVRRHVVEQKQKFLAELYRQADVLEQQKKAMLDQLEEEREQLKNMGAEFQGYFGAYSMAVKNRVEDINEARAKLETRIQNAREEMREAFAELKKIEITQERRAEEAIEAMNKKESAELDEIGIEVFRRANKDDN